MSTESRTVRELIRGAERLRESLTTTIYDEVKGRDTRTLLTLTVRGVRNPPTASVDYVKLLHAYMNTTTTATSGIDDAVSKATITSSGDLLRWCEEDDRFNSTVAEALATDTAFVKEAVAAVAKALEANAPEVEEVIGGAIAITRTSPDSAAGIHVGRQGRSAIWHSAITVVITKTLGTPAIKAAIYHAAHSVAAATAARKAGLIAAKKAGLGLILKALFVKLGVAIGAGHLALLIAVPLVALLLRHEWRTFPQKMAQAVSRDLPAKLADSESPLYPALAGTILTAAKTKIIEQLTDMAAKVREEMSDATGAERTREWLRRCRAHSDE